MGTSERVKLTDRTIKAAKAKPEIYEIRDAEVSGLRLRVHPGGKKTFVLVARYPTSPKHANRRALGEYPTLSLAEARKRAGEWKTHIEKGIDPQEVAAERRREQQRKRANTFAAVAEDYIAHIHRTTNEHGEKIRSRAIIERDIRREFIARWAERPVTEIKRTDVETVLSAAVDRNAPYQAHNLLVYIRSLFNWAVVRDVYGLTSSPCDRLKPKDVIGKKKYRQRALDDDELRAFWRATARMGYPFGTMFRMLLLTGQRKSEISDARWKELAMDQKLLIVPPERFKSNASHLVPLSDDVLALVSELPRFQSGDYLFSTTFGDKPIEGFSKAKARLDRLMLEELRAARGGNAEIPPFVTHDLRRTVRTRLSALRVVDVVAEMVIGHARRGLQRVYDEHKYEPEMREALAAWAARLRSIVEPPPDNVVSMGRGAA
jgi:integrase